MRDGSAAWFGKAQDNMWEAATPPCLSKHCRTVGGGVAAFMKHTLHSDCFLGDGQYVFEANHILL